jgi:hypothetical protein
MQGANPSSKGSNHQFTDGQPQEYVGHANAQHAPDELAQTHLHEQDTAANVQLGAERNTEAEDGIDNVDSQSVSVGAVDNEGVATLSGLGLTPEGKEYTEEQPGDSESEEIESGREVVAKERPEDRAKELQV